MGMLHYYRFDRESRVKLPDRRNVSYLWSTLMPMTGGGQTNIPIANVCHHAFVTARGNSHWKCQEHPWARFPSDALRFILFYVEFPEVLNKLQISFFDYQIKETIIWSGEARVEKYYFMSALLIYRVAGKGMHILEYISRRITSGKESTWLRTHFECDPTVPSKVWCLHKNLKSHILLTNRWHRSTSNTAFQINSSMQIDSQEDPGPPYLFSVR